MSHKYDNIEIYFYTSKHQQIQNNKPQAKKKLGMRLFITYDK